MQIAMSEDTTKQRDAKTPYPHHDVPNSTMDELFKDGGEL
jgi:hypothetical protein